ncbi:hypothetical protein L1987_31986 [Smallanthus sonchifolius]|uniref:Uncharacterized protein n=1 Tax=Smallanthus sonchifolius TaxID=185202 RepID=A0ACB9I740_9ASTR|nr:hypothetical protein L1987_31986 [Smallanthus sonchifolius]
MSEVLPLAQSSYRQEIISSQTIFCRRRLTHPLCNPPNSSLHRQRHHRHHHLGKDYSSFFNLSCFKHFFFSGLLYLKIGQVNRNTIDFGSKIL